MENMKERKFKVGDRVRVIDCILAEDSRKELVGREGVVTYVSPVSKDNLPYDVSFEGYNNGHGGTLAKDVNDCSHRYFNERELEAIHVFKTVTANTHYETSIQPIETMQANMTPEEFVGFLKGNIIKYACRCGRKDEPLKEAKKIKQYAGWLVDALEGRKVDPRKS